ncbi:hypothetical protein CBR_g49482 [Chara braunii]|uniref:Major facilitator superfamily (MFS) profile domain-containing protein n=1 Tax=Chara braunii TaxID=69332 RepID=A0A388K530_CHABU|nr:hypothetical protein CBR_g49482 [Chara braunii]|eukprot:GBG65119.1 hypothetical protein CBR_g49482 [Chara braunii]
MHESPRGALLALTGRLEMSIRGSIRLSAVRDARLPLSNSSINSIRSGYGESQVMRSSAGRHIDLVRRCVHRPGEGSRNLGLAPDCGGVVHGWQEKKGYDEPCLPKLTWIMGAAAGARHGMQWQASSSLPRWRSRKKTFIQGKKTRPGNNALPKHPSNDDHGHDDPEGAGWHSEKRTSGFLLSRLPREGSRRQQYLANVMKVRSSFGSDGSVEDNTNHHTLGMTRIELDGTTDKPSVITNGGAFSEKPASAHLGGLSSHKESKRLQEGAATSVVPSRCIAVEVPLATDPDEDSEELREESGSEQQDGWSFSRLESFTAPIGESWPKRWTIVGLCFSAFLLCNMDRVNMSIAILPMAEEYGWDSTIMGLVQSSFFWGYLLTQIAGGILADKVGGKWVLGFGVIWWSLATVSTPFAAMLGLPALLFARVCMGIGEGVAMPAMNNLLSHWVPVDERSRSLALVYSGMYLGSVTGLAFSPGLIHNYGWPSVFYSFGSLGTIWYLAWSNQAYSTPADDPTLSASEREFILQKNATNTMQLPEKIPWKALLSKPAVWAIIVCHFCHNWGTFILLTWMPTYYNQVLGFNLRDSSLYCVLPWLTMALCANFGGWIADTMVKRGCTVTFVRKFMQTIGFAGPAFFLSRVGGCDSPTAAVLCMMASQGLDAFSQSGLYCNHQDIGPRYAGFLLGLSNTAGVLAGVVGTVTTGYILQHGSWGDVFEVAVGLYLVGIVVWNAFATGERIFD